MHSDEPKYFNKTNLEKISTIYKTVDNQHLSLSNIEMLDYGEKSDEIVKHKIHYKFIFCI
jgi:hypothetical protein